MARTLTLQSSFNAGVLDPRLASRVDIEAYYAGASLGRNVLCTPQGGFKRRPGMKFIHDIALDGRLASFAFNTEQTYLFVLTNLNLEVFKDGVSQANVVTPWTLAQLPDLRWTQSADTMILVHEDHAPRKLVRGALHTAWTLSIIDFTNAPRFKYDDASSPPYTVDVQELDVDGIVTGQIELETNGEVTAFIPMTGVAATNAANIKTALEALPGVGVGITVVNSGGGAGGTYTVTFSGSAGPKYYTPITGRKILVVPPTGITSTHTTEGSDTDEFEWSATRGWPRSVTFHQGRLVFGGAKSRPATLWASVTNDFFNFWYGTGLDDQAISATIDTDQVNAISAVLSGRHLQIFTSGGEFFENSSPWTPSNAAIKSQTSHGSSGLQPVAIDGASLFVERKGKAVREFLFSFAEDAYTAAAISLMAPHLLNTPVDITARKGTDTDDANLVFVVNTDGTMAVLNTLRNENVAGWTEWITDGVILSAVVVEREVYFLVKRTINSVTEYFLEQWDEDHYLDSSVIDVNAPASATVAGLAHLNGESCRVLADGAVMADAVPAGGTITLVRTASVIEVGLDVATLITTMPLNVQLQNGPSLMREKRIIKAQIDVFETSGLIVGGQRVPDRDLVGPLPDVPAPFTGMREVWPVLGWGNIADLTIGQVDPLPMFIRSILLTVEAN